MQGKAYPEPTLYHLGAAARAKEIRGLAAGRPGGALVPRNPAPRGGGGALLEMYVRESIFWICHTNEFCGKSKVANECRVAGAPHQRARRVSESGWPVEQSAGHNTTAIKQLYHILKTFIAWSLEQACRLRSR